MAESRELSLVLKVVNKISDGLKPIERDLASTGKKMESIGKSMTIGLTVPLIAAAVGFGKAASDLEESMNAVEVVFGKGADTVLEFGKNSATSVGLSTAAFNQLSAQTGALLTDMGMPLTAVADLTNELSVAAADAASVMNKDVSQALYAFGSAIRGETEPIRMFTGDVTDASLEQYLLAEGINKTSAELSIGEKRYYRTGLILKQMSKFSGDFERTQGSLANQTKIVTAQTINMSAALGVHLIPAFTKLIGYVNGLLEKLNGLSDETVKNILVFGAFVAALGPVTFALGKVILAVRALKVALIAGRIATLAFLGPIGLVIAIAGTLAAVFAGSLTPSVASASNEIDGLSAEADNLAETLSGVDDGTGAASQGMKNMQDQAKQLEETLDKLRKSALDVIKGVFKDEADYKREVAEEIIEQEKRVAEIQKEIRELTRTEETREDAKRLRELEDNLEKEKAALRGAGKLEQQLSKEIVEAKRRDSLTDFERTLEDLKLRKEEKMQAHLEDLQRIKEEREAALEKDAAMRQSFIDAMNAMQTKLTETTEVAKIQFDVMANDAEKAAVRIQDAFESIGDITGGSFQTSTAAYLPGRASGGPVSAGQPYMVGEKGSELFVPSSNGSIVPNNKLGGGVTIHVHGDVSGRELIDKVGKAISLDIKRRIRV